MLPPTYPPDIAVTRVDGLQHAVLFGLGGFEGVVRPQCPCADAGADRPANARCGDANVIELQNVGLSMGDFSLSGALAFPVGAGDGGHYSQGLYDVYLGLGEATSLKALEIVWPGEGVSSSSVVVL